MSLQKPVSVLQRSELLGFFTHPGTIEHYLESVKLDIDNGNSSSIYYHNLHTLYVYFTSDEYKRSFNDKRVIVDGMGVLFLYKLARFNLTRDYRVTYVDFILPMMRMARDQGWRVFHIGQDADVQQRAFTIIRERVPGVQIAGHHGYFDMTESSSENRDVIGQANDYSADLLLVGLGTPQQELWVDVHRFSLNAPVVLTCGSCMEYVAGEINTAPRWMGRMGLEWLFRTFDDPKRLWFRYLVQPFLLGIILLRNGLDTNYSRI